MLKFIVVVAVVSLVGVSAIELRLNNDVVIDTDKVDCKKANEIIDECSLQQGFSYRFPEYAYPTNHTHLMRSCKLQGDALKCLRAYSKCLLPLSKQVMLALVNSRQKYNKKICLEKPGDNTKKVLEFTQCMRNERTSTQKGVVAETNAITVPESLVNHKFASVTERLKYSCCSVAKVRREFAEAILPGCKQHSQAAIEMIDSYLADTVGIICPDHERTRGDCEKLPKIAPASQPNAKHFIFPTIEVVQTLA